ncbi:MAG: GNAT family N-acetyltransferase, partial [Lentibacter algarum]
QVGGQAGRWLMNEALTRAWDEDISRLFVHTCTLDHPKALAFYIRSGFTPYKRSVEVSPDARATGHLPKSAAPQIPRL